MNMETVQVHLPRRRLPLPSSETLRRLKKFRLNTIPQYIWCTVFTALGGYLWGYDTGSIGPITLMPDFVARFGPISATIQGLVVSCILITASIAAFAAGTLADRISRIYTIGIGAIIFAVGSAIAASAVSLGQLFAGRCLAGVGEGLFTSVLTVYVTEIAPTASRGRLVTMTQLFNVLGIASGYFICYGTVKVPSSFSWRFPLAMQAFTSSVLALGMFSGMCPHSPRWLMHVGRLDEVDIAWAKLGVSRAEAEKEAEAMVREQAAANASRGRPWYRRAQDMFRKGVAGRTMFGVFLMAMQQMSGIDAVLYYAPVLFAQAGLSETEASFLASGVSGLLNIVAVVVVQLFADKWGRRGPMIGGGVVIGSAMLLMGILYASGANDAPAGRWAIIVLIYIFVVGFVATWAVTCRIVVAEVQPIKTRNAASSLSQCVSWAVNWTIAFSTPLFLARSGSGPYFLFGSCSLLTAAVCMVVQPETKGLSLEDLDRELIDTPWRKAMAKLKGRASDPVDLADDGDIPLQEMSSQKDGP
ncbi:general substrate transporter [Calocera viscosa TUFC12733]|uniref:General substrate transporter n=1 Tax=Calocera viscosa (strain TUFC12733) TaxID=1330018 RepID=A0A167HNF4_CALVF|nr:general substrate transporter [Calocera viscosa TUFC12733]